MSRALLVIDVQNEYFSGALPITYPVGHLDRILAVMDAAEGRVPVVVVQHQMADGPIFRKGSKAWELHPEVAQRPRELLVEKTLPGSFTNTPLEDWLRQRGIDTVTIAGYMTHMCCDTTAAPGRASRLQGRIPQRRDRHAAAVELRRPGDRRTTPAVDPLRPAAVAQRGPAVVGVDRQALIHAARVGKENRPPRANHGGRLRFRG